MNVIDQWKDAIETLTKQDKILGNIIWKYDEEKLKLRGKPFETLARSIVGQQISVKAADSVWTKLEKLCDGKIEKMKISDMSEQSMKSAGLSRQKTNYLKNVANSDVLDTDWRKLSDEKSIKKLCEIKGVGVWTAEMFLIFNLGRPNIFPVGDIGLVRAIELHYYDNKRVDLSKIKKFKEKWSPWCTVATWYLWRSIDPVPVEY